MYHLRKIFRWKLTILGYKHISEEFKDIFKKCKIKNSKTKKWKLKEKWSKKYKLGKEIEGIEKNIDNVYIKWVNYRMPQEEYTQMQV